MFHNRVDAGIRLAKSVKEKLRNSNASLLVLGIPRGGVVVAAEVARTLQAPLDIIVTKKIGSPGNPEYAIGAVDLDGEAVWNDADVQALGLSVGQQTQLVSSTLKAAHEKDALLRQGRAPLSMKDKTVVLVDDGIATGYTTRAAIAYIHRRKPARLVLAVPVAPSDTLEMLWPFVDEIICLKTPEPFGAVGAFYEEFPQVEDEEVRNLLTGA